MKIVIVTFVAQGAGIHYTAQLANALSKGNDTTAIIPGYAEARYFDKLVKLVSLPIPSQLLPSILKVASPFFWSYLVSTLVEIQPEVVHVVYEHRFPFIYAFLLHRKYPIVLTMHEPKAIPNRGRVGNVLVALIQYVNNKLLAEFSDKVVIHGGKLKSCRLISRLSSQKIEIVPHGDYSFFAPSYDTAPADANNLLFFGRIAPYKGIEYLIQAAKLVKREIPDMTVTIAGDGDFTKYRAIIGSDNSFIILNRYITDDEVAELFQKASLVVLPYTDGSQTGIISIAGSFKRPVIATDVGTFSEMVENGKTGFVVPPRDSNALAEAIIRLLGNNELRRKMGANAYNTIKEKFSWNTIALKMLEVYNQAIKLQK